MLEHGNRPASPLEPRLPADPCKDNLAMPPPSSRQAPRAAVPTGPRQGPSAGGRRDGALTATAPVTLVRQRDGEGDRDRRTRTCCCSRIYITLARTILWEIMLFYMGYSVAGSIFVSLRRDDSMIRRFRRRNAREDWSFGLHI